MNFILTIAFLSLLSNYAINNPTGYFHHQVFEENHLSGEVDNDENNRSVLYTAQYNPNSTGTFCNNYSYFTKLTNNFGNNAETEATCVSVAAAILLDYYDTVLNDNIVSESFDVKGNSTQSPGTLYEADSGLPFNSVALYYNYLRDNYISTSLHAYLLLKNKNALVSNPSPLANSYHYELTTNWISMSSTLSSYISDKNMSSYATIVAATADYNPGPNYITNEQVFNAIKAEIDAGRPVGFGVYGHAMVAFGYNGNYLYAHNGYKESNQHYNLVEVNMQPAFTMTNDFVDYCSIHFSYSHTHSFNYYSGGVSWCICGHSHSYTSSYQYYNNNYHRSYCSCGDYILERHTYRINMNLNPCVCGSHL